VPRPALSPELIDFIRTSLSSYDAAVLLVFMSRHPDRAWSLDEIVSDAGVGPLAPRVARQTLDDLARAGLIAAIDDRFGYRPASEALRRLVDELRIAYDERPVTLIRIIDSAARARLQSFADSFKLKRD
jgi:hypothetical protein